MKTELSDLKCRKATPKEKPYRIADKGGLGLRVTPAGGKLWRFSYRFQGKMKEMALGQYPDVPLAEARIRHASARGELAKGIDPMALRKEAKEQKKAEEELVEVKSTGITVGELVWKWFDWWKMDKDFGYVSDVESRTERDIVSKVGDRKPGDMTRNDWVAVIQAIDRRGARDLARRALHNVNQIYEFGMDHGFLDPNAMNPVAGVRPEKILSKAQEKHFPSLPLSDIPGLLQKMQDYSGTAVTRICMELMALTFLRTSELIESLWSDIDWEAKLWRLTKEQMKRKKKPHIVPLAPQTLALLKRLHAITGKTGRLFPGMIKGAETMSNNTILKALERMGYKGLMTGHGFRSVASTYLHEKGFEHEHIELQLAHSPEDKVSAAYNYAKYLEPRMAMMCAWADALDQLREKSLSNE